METKATYPFYRVRSGWRIGTKFAIQVVEAVKHTDKTVTIIEDGRERRQSLVSDWYKYFPSREEAVAFLVDRANSQIEKACKMIGDAERALNEFGSEVK